jgi:hypothetical protein
MKRYPFEDWRRELSEFAAGSDALDERRFERIARVARHYAE